MKSFFFFLSLTLALWHANISHALMPIERFQTKQGVPVIFYQAMDIPMVNISLAFRAGAAYDGQQYGLSTLTTRLLNQGNDGLSADELANLLGETGAQFSSENNLDMVVLHLKTLTETVPYTKATSLFRRIVKQPDFPEKAFIREKNQQIMAIKQALESPDEIANQTFFRALYQTHPYAHPVNGDFNTLQNIQLADVRQFHKRYFVRQNAILVIVGALKREDAEVLAEQITQDIPKGKKAPRIPKAKLLRKSMDIRVPFSSSQTSIRLGQLGITHHDPDYFPLLVGNYVLGGGALVSRLAEELREKRGLTYGVNSQFIPLPATGPFMVGFSTKGEQASMAESLTRDTLTTFVETGPNEAELQAAKQYLIGSFPLSIANNQNMASILLKIAFYELPENYLETYQNHVAAVSVSDIQAAFKKTLHPQQLLQIMVGKS